MLDYNISSFIRLMQAGLIESNTQEAAGRLLLESIEIDEELPDITAKVITNLVKRNTDVIEIIKKASTRSEVTANAIHYFEDIVVPDLNPHLKNDICSNIITLLEVDSSVSKSKADELISLHNKDEIGEFLARSFLYAVSRPNKQVKIDVDAEIDDAPFIYEVDNKCPLCHKPLVKLVNRQPIRAYNIEDISSKRGSDNKIALCMNCSLEHRVFGSEFAQELSDIKKESLKHINFQETMDNVSLEFEIRDVIFELVNISSNIEQGEFKLDMMRLDEKISPENIFLLNNLKDDVLKYYRFIEDLLSRVGIYEDVSLDIRKAYNKIQKIYLDQNDVVYYLSDWIFNKTNLSKPAHRRACDIIVAFFVQNCEVFDAIT